MLDRFHRGRTQSPSGQLHGISFNFMPAVFREDRPAVTALQLIALTLSLVAAGAVAAEVFAPWEFTCAVNGSPCGLSIQFSWSCGC